MEHCTNAGANPKLTSVSQRGPQQQERERWARRAPRTPRPARAAGRTRWRQGTPLAAAPSPALQVSAGPPRGGARCPHRPLSRRHHHRAGNLPPGPSPDPQGLRAGATRRPLGLRAPSPGTHVGAGRLCPLADGARAESERGGQAARPRTRRTQAAGGRRTADGRGPGLPGRRPVPSEPALPRPTIAAPERRVPGVRFSPHGASEGGARAGCTPGPISPWPREPGEPRDGVGGSEAPRGVKWPFCPLPRAVHSLNNDPSISPRIAV